MDTHSRFKMRGLCSAYYSTINGAWQGVTDANLLICAGCRRIPFRHEQVLDVLWWPSHKAAHASRSAVAKSTTWSRKPEGHELLSEKCPNCGKTASDIERAWREGPQQKVDQRKRLEELKKLGFSGIVRG